MTPEKVPGFFVREKLYPYPVDAVVSDIQAQTGWAARQHQTTVSAGRSPPALPRSPGRVSGLRLADGADKNRLRYPRLPKCSLSGLRLVRRVQPEEAHVLG